MIQEQNVGGPPASAEPNDGAAIPRKQRVHTTPVQRPERTPWRKRLKLAMFFVVRAIGLCRLARWFTRRSVLIIGWHCVSMTDEHRRFSSLFISPESLRQRLEFLKRNYRIITLDEALRQKRAGRLEPYQAILTFDDGYYNVYSEAAPILRELKMPATVYMVTARIDAQTPTYNHLVSDIILTTSLTAAEVTTPGLEGAADLGNQAAKVAFMRRAIRAYPQDESKQEVWVRRLADDLEVDMETYVRSRVWHSMNAAEVRELNDSGMFDMQLHTHEHKNVVDYPDATYDQVRICREDLERRTGRPARHFCYPQGYWNRHVWASLKRAGVETATTTQNGPNFVSTPDLALRRFLDGEDRTQLEFEVETSHLRWLLHVLFHPRRWSVPNEKLQAYFESPQLF